MKSNWFVLSVFLSMFMLPGCAEIGKEPLGHQWVEPVPEPPKPRHCRECTFSLRVLPLNIGHADSAFAAAVLVDSIGEPLQDVLIGFYASRGRVESFRHTDNTGSAIVVVKPSGDDTLSVIHAFAVSMPELRDSVIIQFISDTLQQDVI